MTGQNLIVTGIPRGGTTLAAALIDALDDAVCINEPLWQSKWSREAASRQRYVERIVDDFARVRATLLAGGSVAVRASGDGEAVTNFFDRGQGPRRRKPLTTAPLSRPGLTPGFLLAMKHNAHYSCVLGDLAAVPGLSVLAIIRDPVAVLASWRSLNLPVSRGRLPAGEPFWPEIGEARRGTDDLLLVQARMVELFFRRYHELRDRIAIVRYEDIVGSPGLLARRFGRRPLRQVPVTPVEPPVSAEITMLRDYVAAHCPTACRYYPPDGISPAVP
jgi:hypothetical protein